MTSSGVDTQDLKMFVICGAVDELDGSPCEFEGQVDALTDGFIVSWDCPSCGTFYGDLYQDAEVDDWDEVEVDDPFF